MNVSIILPCFNSEKFINNSYIRLKKKIKELKLKPEIIFIDDGSEDKTYESLKNLKKKNKGIKIFKNKFNMGKYFSLIKAIKKSKNQAIVIWDCDLPYINRFNKIVLELKKYDLVLIDRNQKKSKFITKKLNFYQFSRLIVGKMVSLSLSLIICKNFIGDTQAGLKSFKKPKNFNKIKFISKKFFFDAELISLFSNSQKKILSIPINYSIAYATSSTIKIFCFNNFVYLWEFLKIIFNKIFTKNVYLN